MMKILSIKQPWLWSIMHAGKDIENRTWKPPMWLIGKRIGLHASKSIDRDGVDFIKSQFGYDVLPENLPLGVILATAVLCGYVDGKSKTYLHSMKYSQGVDHQLYVEHIMSSKWFFGPIGWVFADVKILEEPILCNGKLGLWDYDLNVAKKL